MIDPSSLLPSLMVIHVAAPSPVTVVPSPSVITIVVPSPPETMDPSPSVRVTVVPSSSPSEAGASSEPVSSSVMASSSTAESVVVSSSSSVSDEVATGSSTVLASDDSESGVSAPALPASDWSLAATLVATFPLPRSPTSGLASISSSLRAENPLSTVSSSWTPRNRLPIPRKKRSIRPS